MAEVIKRFLGTGWKFPPTLDARGRIALAEGELDVEEAIRIILLTNRGERQMRPRFGSDLQRLMFDPCSALTCSLAGRYVQDALAQWEPRIRVIEVTARPDSEDAARMMIMIRYELVANRSQRNMVFPFYTLPGESK